MDGEGRPTQQIGVEKPSSPNLIRFGESVKTKLEKGDRSKGAGKEYLPTPVDTERVVEVRKELATIAVLESEIDSGLAVASGSLAQQSAKSHSRPKESVEIKLVASADEVSQRVKEQIPDSMKFLTVDDLDKLRQELKTKPQLGSGVLYDTLRSVEQHSAFAWVQTSKIVGIAHEEPDSWAHEIEDRKGRVAKVAKEIIAGANGNLQEIEHVFHPNKPSERIKVIEIEGPAGPMYFVDDGTHRVSACMTIDMAEVPCDVRKTTYPVEQVATEDYQAEDWQRKIELGLIDGEIQEQTDSHGKKTKKLVARGGVLPWIHTVSDSNLIKISKIYEQLYPNSLDNLPMPREALVDPVANTFFMAGRWEEWLQQKQ